jgi:internalin A
MVRAKTIEALATLKNLKSLNLGQTLIADVSPISGLTSLESLDIRGTRVTDLRPLVQDQDLRELTIGGAQLPSLVNLAHLPNLKKISIIEQQGTDLSAIGALTNLESLWIWGGSAPLDVLPLRSLTKLCSYDHGIRIRSAHCCTKHTGARRFDGIENTDVRTASNQ